MSTTLQKVNKDKIRNPNHKGFKFDMPRAPEIKTIKDTDTVNVKRFKIQQNANNNIVMLEFLDKLRNKKQVEIRSKQQDINRSYKELEDINSLINTIKGFKMLDYY